MPHASLKLIPGVDQNRTPALNEAALSSSNLIRFMPDRQGLGLPQKLGGWSRFLQQAISATVRALHSWSDTNDNLFLSIGTDTGLLTSRDKASPIDRSPERYSVDIPVSFSTTAGSSRVQITDVGSNVSSYDAVYIETPVSIGGLVLSGFYPCIADTNNTYFIIARNILGSPTPATATATGGAVPSLATTVSPATQNVTVTLNDHGLKPGSTFTLLVPVPVGGVTLYGNYLVLTDPAPTTNTFVIAASTAASSAATVSMNGGSARIIYYMGQQATSPSPGYGSGGFGYGAYGTGVTYDGGRTYSSVSISSTGGLATVTKTGMNIPVGSSIVISGTTTFNGEYQIKTSAPGQVQFSFSGAHGAETGTLKVTEWAYVMPPVAQKDWSLDHWGEYMIASPKGGEIFYWNPSDSSGHSIVVPNAPLINEGAFIAMPERQIIAFGSTFTGIQDPLLVRWCDIGDFTDWVGTVTNQAGSFRIPKGSKIVGGIQGPQQGLLWTDIGLWAMQYINQPLIYSFNEIASGCGLAAMKAVGVLANTVYWMSQSQFFTLSGGGVQPLNCPIWDVVFQSIDRDYIDYVRCAPNSRFNEIAWFFPVISNKGTNLEGKPTNYVKYNAILNQWDYGEMTRSAWIDQGIFGPPIGASRQNYIFQHETSPDADGAAMQSSFQTGYFALDDGDVKTFVDQVWPDMKWGLFGQAQDAEVSITFYAADYPGQTPVVYGPFKMTQSSPQFITPRMRARLVSIKISSSDVGSFWRLGNIRYRYQPDGKF